MSIQAESKSFIDELSSIESDYQLTTQLWSEYVNAASGEQLTERQDTSREAAIRLNERAMRDTCSIFERYVVSVFGIYLDNHQTELDLKLISVERILQATDLSKLQVEAFELAKESKVMDLAYKAAGKWFRQLEVWLQFEISKSDQEAFICMKAKRNAVEHAGGLTGQKLLDDCPALGLSIGDSIAISDADVSLGIDLIRRLIVQVEKAGLALGL